MINDNCRACLVDFSLIRLAPDQSTVISTLLEGGTQRWMSPELLDPKPFGLKGSHPTKESDRFALGMVIYEILSGQAPFVGLTPHVASLRILEGRRPKRPREDKGERFTDSLWNVLERCWRHKPGNRATAKEVLVCLGGTITSLSRQSSQMTYDGDAEENSDDQWDTPV
jgi:serine/threonine protein kinase